MIFDPSLEPLSTVGPYDFKEQQAIKEQWADIFAKDFAHFDIFYTLIIEAGQTVLGTQPPSPPKYAFTRETAETFLSLASATDYLHSFGSKPAIEARLAQNAETILSLITQMTAQAPQRPELAAPVEALMSLFFHHASFGEEAEGVFADLMRVIPDVLMAFPEHRFPFAFHLLTKSADAAEQIGRVTIFHIVERGDLANDFCMELAERVIDLAKGHKSFGELGAEVMGPVARAVREGRPEICEDFVTAFVLMPLHCNRPGHEEEIARLEAELSTLRARLKSFEARLKAPTGVTAQDTPLVLDLSEKREELERVQNDFDRWMEERWNFALREVATRPNMNATLRAIQGGLSPLRNAELDRLLSDAAEVTPDEG